jgi:hypothetical protein
MSAVDLDLAERVYIVTGGTRGLGLGSVFLGALRVARSAAAVLPPGGVIGFVLSSSVKSPLSQLWGGG